VLIALAVGLLFWTFESALHAFVFGEGPLLAQMFMPAGHEAWMRLLVMAIFFAFGVFIQTVVNQRRRTEANLEHRVDERTRELAQRNEELAVLNYRERLSRELHDAVTQTLFSASLMADALPRMWDSDPERARRQLGEIGRLTRSALAELRVLLLDLRPASLADGDVERLLRQLAESLDGRAGMAIDLNVEGTCSLPPQSRAAIYRIAHEALNNAVKHAGASRSSVTLCCGPEQIELSIEDDGCGFDPREVPAGKLGLGIMRERAEASGATLQVRSRAGDGTRVNAVWPRPMPG
jgi:signal transduction histidine kinase